MVVGKGGGGSEQTCLATFLKLESDADDLTECKLGLQSQKQQLLVPL